MGLDGCRETRRTGTEEAARKPRQDFSIQKGLDFSSLMTEHVVKVKLKVGPFCSNHKIACGNAIRKEKKKKKKKNVKSKTFSLFPPEISSLFSFFPYVFFLLLHHHC